MVALSPQWLCSKGCIVILAALAAAGHAVAQDAAFDGALHAQGRLLMQGGLGGAGGAGGASGGSGSGGAGGAGGAGGGSASGVAGLGGNGGAGGASPSGAAGAGGAGGGGGASPLGIAGGGGSGGKGGNTLTGTVGQGGASGPGGAGKVPGKPGNEGASGNQPPGNPPPGNPAPGTATASLAPVFIQAITNDTQTKECIAGDKFSSKGKTNVLKGSGVQVSLLLPSKNPPPLAALTLNTYDITSLTLAGIPAQTKTATVTINSNVYLVVDFNDVKGVLAPLNGTMVSFVGSYSPPGGTKYVFKIPFKVCV